MKHNTIKLSIVATLSSTFVISAVSFSFKKADVKVTYAATLPKVINLNDNTDSQIKSYYSSLSSLPQAQLSGTNLLKNLKGIISNNVTYYSFDQLTNAYVITERDWTNSPASEMQSSFNYDENTNTINNLVYGTEVTNNPYIKMLYVDSSVKDKTRYKGDGDMDPDKVSFDKEHIWSQSHGFASGADNATGAGSDMHHLRAGAQYGNRTLHNNYSYGFVSTNDSEWSATLSANTYPYEKSNRRGTARFPHPGQDQSGTSKIFEPQDSDKGDIARALLYMVACYNNLDGSTPTKIIPALWLQNYFISENSTGYSSVNLANGYYGCLQDILAWHAMDPVDDFEIHRNNIIYNNYQHNRNPFIDYPQWVDYIWGKSTYNPDSKTINYDPTSTGYVDLSADVINGYRSEEPLTLTITSQPTKTEYYIDESLSKTGLVVTATFETYPYERNVTNDCSFDYDFSTSGTKTVTISYRGLSCSFTVTVLDINLEGIYISSFPEKTEYRVGDTLDTTGLLVTGQYSNGDEADVTDNCEFEYDFSSTGNKAVTVRCGEHTASFQVMVRKAPSPDEPTNNVDMKTILIYVAIGVGAVLLIVGILTGVVKVSKKGKVKVSKSGVKKVVKKTTKKKK